MCFQFKLGLVLVLIQLLYPYVRSDLKDERDDCKVMAQTKDYCKAGGKYAEWMWKNCRKSCDYFYGYQDAAEYKDDCPKWASDGYCKRSHSKSRFMWKNCMKSCQSTGCNDEDDKCPTWKDEYGCENKVMGTECRKSCDMCPGAQCDSDKSCGSNAECVSNECKCKYGFKGDPKLNCVAYPIDCEWIPWSTWEPCSATCGGGTRSRVRTVAVPAIHGGKECEGSDKEEESCNEQPCAIDCEWNEWKEWGACSLTCGPGGVQTRTRTKKVEEANGGNCSGDYDDYRGCSPPDCPAVDCEWNDWSSWGDCSVTCGDKGTQIRTRNKKVVEEFGGNCVGEGTQSQDCNAPCQCRTKQKNVSCPDIKDRTECLQSRDDRQWFKYQDCVWCLTPCDEGNVCEPKGFLEGKGKKEGTDFESCR